MDAIIKLLKGKGQRLTSQKKEVIQVLQKKPLTVLQILTLVKSKKGKIDKATVYRILTNFVKLGIVKEINLGAREVHYELTNCDHHHHLVCENCGHIEDIQLCEDELLKEVQKQSQFRVKEHSLEFFGTCIKCQ
ncbi:MAG: Fur family transcriptional regulator [Candidatus Roizmanbacteria bacterium]|nr:Fur family transcriptional regulator [Candidatus Roizmanbacteria bacterium]